MSLTQPHFVRDYRRAVRRLARKHDRKFAMEQAVGGGYEVVGSAQAALLYDVGLRDGQYLIDVGCGSGRTAFAVRNMASLRYHGTDVVQQLLDYAKERAARPDWRFSLVESLTIPERDECADFVVMFSVVTHLTAGESLSYLTEAARVTKPGGRIVVSFLDTSIAAHRTMAGNGIRQLLNRLRGKTVKNVLHHPDDVGAWARALSLDAQFLGPERIGQSICVMTKLA